MNKHGELPQNRRHHLDSAEFQQLVPALSLLLRQGVGLYEIVETLERYMNLEFIRSLFDPFL